MKKILLFSLACLTLGSCKFDDKEINLGFTTVYFVNQEYNRNLVVGEGLEMNVGVTLSGVVNNTTDRYVYFQIDPTLISAEGKSLLPAESYTLSDPQKICIRKGTNKGYVTVKLDSTAFLSDAKSLTGELMIPFRLTELTDIDRITADKGTINISLSYFAKQHGNYTYNGTTVQTPVGGASQVSSYKNDATVTESVRKLTTVGPQMFEVVADPKNNSDVLKSKGVSFYIEIPTLGGGDVIIKSKPEAPIAVAPSGEYPSRYDEATKTLYLYYKYSDAAQTECIASDTLVFRNRIRDVQANGQYINEWRGF